MSLQVKFERNRIPHVILLIADFRANLKWVTNMDPTEKKKILALEQELIGEKPWQLKGEVSANSRPLNSLLFEDVNFEQRIKAPSITAETTEGLEELIKQRIRDNKFDDPERKVKFIAKSQSNREVEVSQERSKVGLAQLYEQELIAKATGAASTTRDGEDKEVETRLYALFRKLDALVDR